MDIIKRVLTNDLHQSWGILMLFCGIIVGAIIGVIFRINYFASPVWIGLVVAILVIMYVKPKLLTIGLCLIMGMIIAFFRVATELDSENYVRQFYGFEITVSGVIDGDPEIDEKTTKIKLRELKLGEDNDVRGSVYVNLEKNEELKRGDGLALMGKLEAGFGTYVGYMYKPRVMRILKPNPGDLVVEIRDIFAERIRKLMPTFEVNLGLSYLLGMKTGLADDLDNNLRMVGLTHIVVASGTHLSILVEIARKIFGRLSRFAGMLFSVLFVVFFMAMVGWTPSILRAGIMTILTIITWYVGRKISPLRLIIMVAAITLMIEPTFLMNLGWLLSFASYIGIMLIGPLLTKIFYGEKRPGFVASIILTTVAATMMTLPILLYYYGQVSLISIMANLLILPTLPFAMGFCFLTGIVAGVPIIDSIVGTIATKILDFHIGVVEWFGKMEQFLIKIDPYEPRVFLLYLVVLVPIAIYCFDVIRNKGSLLSLISKENRLI